VSLVRRATGVIGELMITAGSASRRHVVFARMLRASTRNEGLPASYLHVSAKEA